MHLFPKPRLPTWFSPVPLTLFVGEHKDYSLILATDVIAYPSQLSLKFLKLNFPSTVRKVFSLTDTNHVFIISSSISNTTVFYLEAGLPHPKLRAYKSIWWLIDARNFGYDVSARRPARPAIHTLIKDKRRLCRGGTGSSRHESLCKPWRNVSQFKCKHGIFMSYLFVPWFLNNPFLKFRYQWMCFQSMC